MPDLQRLRFVVYGVAQPAGSKRWLPRGGKAGGAPIVVDAAKGSRQWKGNVAEVAAVAMAGRVLIDGPVELTLTFEVPRPRSHYGARGLRPSAPRFPSVRPDVLKLARAVEDACTGIVWRDDAQVVTEHLVKRYGDPAGVTVEVVELPSLNYAGLAAALSPR